MQELLYNYHYFNITIIIIRGGIIIIIDSHDIHICFINQFSYISLENQGNIIILYNRK